MQNNDSVIRYIVLPDGTIAVFKTLKEAIETAQENELK